MHSTERGIAIADVVDQDPNRGQVVNVVEVFSPTHHLLINRVKLLGPTGDVCFDFGLAQVVSHLIHDAIDIRLALRAAVFHQGLDFDINLGLQHRE